MKHTYLYENPDPEHEDTDDGHSRKKLLLIFIAVISIIVLIICIVTLVLRSLSSYREAEKIRELANDIVTDETGIISDEETGRRILSGESENTDISAKYRKLYERNNDFAGWISIDGTKIDYPVMLTPEDEEYYLHRNFDRQDSDAGLPFMDSRCLIGRPSTNLLIFGHNMKNGDMFADLLKYSDKAYYDEHRYIHFDTVYEEGLYEIIAAFRTRVAYKDENTFRFYNFIEADSDAEFEYYLLNINKLALYDTGVEVKPDDRLLTLTTCEYTVEDGRFVVVARRITEDTYSENSEVIP